MPELDEVVYTYVPEALTPGNMGLPGVPLADLTLGDVESYPNWLRKQLYRIGEKGTSYYVPVGDWRDPLYDTRGLDEEAPRELTPDAPVLDPNQSEGTPPDPAPEVVPTPQPRGGRYSPPKVTVSVPDPAPVVPEQESST